MDRREYLNLVAKNTSKACRGCLKCNGYGCIGEVPGMGGKGRSGTFINNYKSWKDINVELGNFPLLGAAPMTGVEQNMGNPYPEGLFHDYMVEGAKKAGILSCIGDGTPNFKLLNGGDALRKHNVKGLAFIKPYTNKLIMERGEWVLDTIESLGVDIDSYKIDTMKGMVTMEKKTSSMLREIKKHFKSVQFAVKGIANNDDVELVRDVKPDIVVISNHGGRVFDNGEGIAYRLQYLFPRIKNFCGEVWVDGGLRINSDFRKAYTLGAKRVLIGRPFIQMTSVFKGDGIPRFVDEIRGDNKNL